MGSSMQETRLLNRKQEVLPQSAFQELRTLVKGDVVVKGAVEEEVYKAAIDRWNKAWVQEADIIVFCEGDDDVVECLKYVQKWSLELVISAGRHSYYGASSITGGFVIDLSKMNKVDIDVEGVSITAQGGCLARDLERPLAEKGFAVVMGAANDTGIGGLTLGGGTGFLTGQHGMVIDNLLAAKVVLADGSILEASEKSNSDLFWAIRGGGSNFGVVTEFTYRIHEQNKDVFFGFLGFPSDKTKEFLATIETIRKIVDSQEGKLAVFVALSKVPPQLGVHPLAVVFYNGPGEEARKLIAPLTDLEPFMNATAMKPYTQVTEPGPLGVRPNHNRYSVSNAIQEEPLDLDVVQSVIDDLDVFFNKHGNAVAPSKAVMEIRYHGVTEAVKSSAMAFAPRNSSISLIVEAQYDDSVTNDTMRQEVKAMTDKAKAIKQKNYPGNKVVHNLNIGSGTEKVRDAYGENWTRLRELKRKYDPNFVFNKWYPIPPAETSQL